MELTSKELDPLRRASCIPKAGALAHLSWVVGRRAWFAATAFNALTEPNPFTEPALLYLHDHVSETNSLCSLFIYFALINTYSFGLLIVPALVALATTRQSARP